MATQTKIDHKVIAFIMAALMVLSMAFAMTVPTHAASYTWSTLSISSSKTMKCYLVGTSNQTTYTTSALSKKSGAVYVSDEITVLEIGKNSSGTWYAKIKYPISKGTKTAYIALNKLSSVTSGSFISKTTAVTKLTSVYRRPGTTTYSSSYISAGDTVYVVARSGNYTQVVYPVSSGWKMAWLSTSTANAYLANSCSVSGISSGSTVSMNAGGTKSLSASVISGASVTWSTSNSSVASLSSAASKTTVLTAKSSGTATITMKVNNTSYSCSFTVKVSGVDTTAASSDTSRIINRLKNDTSLNLGAKKEGMINIAAVLLNKGYEPAFVAGVLGNYRYEADSGMFESSAYSNTQKKPSYLVYADNLYSYRTKYSGKYITSVSLADVKAMLVSMKKDDWNKGKFGLGCLQWTGERTMTLFNLYVEEAGGKDTITASQVKTAEGKMILKELSGSYKSVYTGWKSENSNLNSANAAYNAAKRFMLKYEIPADQSQAAIEKRCNMAQKIYNVIIG